MKLLFLAIFTYIAAAVQTSGVICFSADGSPVMLMPLAAVLAVLLLDGTAAVLAAGIIGLIGDALTAEPLGVHMLAAVLICVVGLRIYRDTPPARQSVLLNLLFAASLILLHALLVVIVARLMTGGPASPETLLSVSLRSGIHTLMAGGVLLLLRNTIRFSRHQRSDVRGQPNSLPF